MSSTPEELNAEIVAIFDQGGAVKFCPSRYALASCVHAEGHAGRHETIGLTGAVCGW